MTYKEQYLARVVLPLSWGRGAEGVYPQIRPLLIECLPLSLPSSVKEPVGRPLRRHPWNLRFQSLFASQFCRLRRCKQYLYWYTNV